MHRFFSYNEIMKNNSGDTGDTPMKHTHTRTGGVPVDFAKH